MIAESKFYRLVREFSASTPLWGAAIRYEVLPDEAHNVTLTSRRVYGTPLEYLAVMAATGLRRFDQELQHGITYTFPTKEQLQQLKNLAGYQVPTTTLVR